MYINLRDDSYRRRNYTAIKCTVYITIRYLCCCQTMRIQLSNDTDSDTSVKQYWDFCQTILIQYWYSCRMILILIQLSNDTDTILIQFRTILIRYWYSCWMILIRYWDLLFRKFDNTNIYIYILIKLFIYIYT